MVVGGSIQTDTTPGNQVLLVCATDPQASHRTSCPVTLNHVLVANVLWGVVGGSGGHISLGLQEEWVRV